MHSIGDWNAKIGHQEIPGIIGRFGLGVQNEAGQRLTALPREHTGYSKHPLPTTQEKTLHIDLTEIRLIIFFAAKDGEALYSQQKKDVLFITGDWNAKVGSREVPGITSKFGLGVQNEAGQRLTVLPRECTGHRKHNLSTTRDNTTHGHHQMVNTEIRLIIFFAAEDGEALYSQQKQNQELTVA